LNKFPNKPTMFISMLKTNEPEKIRFQRKCCHEFGHILGFVHGQLHPDFHSKLDLTQVQILKGKVVHDEIKMHFNYVYNQHHLSKEGYFLTPFDADSVMNYTFSKEMFKNEKDFNEKYSLQTSYPSALDREALANAYSPKYMNPTK